MTKPFNFLVDYVELEAREELACAELHSLSILTIGNVMEVVRIHANPNRNESEMDGCCVFVQAEFYKNKSIQIHTSRACAVDSINWWGVRCKLPYFEYELTEIISRVDWLKWSRASTGGQFFITRADFNLAVEAELQRR